MRTEEFDALSDSEAAAMVTVWAAVPGWVDAIVAGRPYGSVEALAERATALASEWTQDDLDAALAHHPRIGERPQGEGPAASASQREQSGMTDAAAGVAAAISQGNHDYEQRFGRVFLIRAADRTPEQMLAELERRLGNDADAETAEALAQLAEIALRRLRGTIIDQTPEET